MADEALRGDAEALGDPDDLVVVEILHADGRILGSRNATFRVTFGGRWIAQDFTSPAKGSSGS